MLLAGGGCVMFAASVSFAHHDDVPNEKLEEKVGRDQKRSSLRAVAAERATPTLWAAAGRRGVKNIGGDAFRHARVDEAHLPSGWCVLYLVPLTAPLRALD